MKKTFLIVFLLLTGIVPTIAQEVSFQAKLSKRSLGLNERLRVDFIMNKNGDNFTPPNFTGFRVVGGPNQSISNSWVNGKEVSPKLILIF